MQQSFRGFEQDPADHNDQAQAVDQGGQNLQPLITERTLVIGRFFRKLEGGPGQPERQCIGQHVAGIGQQCQRTRQQPADHLDNHEAAGQQRGKQQAPGVFFVGRVVVDMHAPIVAQDCAGESLVSC